MGGRKGGYLKSGSTRAGRKLSLKLEDADCKPQLQGFPRKTSILKGLYPVPACSLRGGEGSSNLKIRCSLTWNHRCEPHSNRNISLLAIHPEWQTWADMPESFWGPHTAQQLTAVSQEGSRGWFQGLTEGALALLGAVPLTQSSQLTVIPI